MMKGVQFGNTGAKKNKSPKFAFTTDQMANFSGRVTPYKTIYTIFDTGTSFTLIPANYWKAYTE
jgi:hypothetical protein